MVDCTMPNFSSRQVQQRNQGNRLQQLAVQTLLINKRLRCPPFPQGSNKTQTLRSDCQSATLHAHSSVQFRRRQSSFIHHLFSPSHSITSVATRSG